MKSSRSRQRHRKALGVTGNHLGPAPKFCLQVFIFFATTLLPAHPAPGVLRSTLAYSESSVLRVGRFSWVSSGGAWSELQVSQQVAVTGTEFLPRSLSDIGSCSILCCQIWRHEMAQLQDVVAYQPGLRNVGQAPSSFSIRLREAGYTDPAWFS